MDSKYVRPVKLVIESISELKCKHYSLAVLTIFISTQRLVQKHTG